MKPLEVNWSNRLEKLADNMFDSLFGNTRDPMIPVCIVTNGPVMRTWLRHHFIFNWSKQNRNRILANCDFQYLLPFINDWMYILLNTEGKQNKKRNPRNHPYSTENMQWRIYKLLAAGKLNTDDFKEIQSYLGDASSPRRQFQLAGKLAAIFDDYQVYRSDIVNDWAKNGGYDWQGKLWQLLINDNPDSYAALFNKMKYAQPAQLTAAFDRKYEQVAIFGTTLMPVPYIVFLNDILAEVVNVKMYILNPGKEYWMEDITGHKQKKLTLEIESLEIPDDPLMVPQTGHELLCKSGESLQEYLYVVNELCLEGEYDLFEEPAGNNILSALQKEILNNNTGYDSGFTMCDNTDDSIQIHICHSARREVEVLYDHLLHWFSVKKNNNENIQPYQIQVLVSDITLYAPYIDAVFGAIPENAPDAIPYAIEAHTTVSDSKIVNAFLSICNIVNSRFQITPVIDLLANESILQSCNLDPSDLSVIERIVAAGNIRWGLDAEHRKEIANIDMPPYMTWEYGLDRLIAGFATGISGWHNNGRDDLLTVDYIEGNSSIILGKLTDFIYRLKSYKEQIDIDRTLYDWYDFMTGLLDTFFYPTENTYREISRIRDAINNLPDLAANCELTDKIPFEIISTHLANVLSSTTVNSSLTANAVIFSQLRPMNSRPAQITCLLGLNDSSFPRMDNRPTFDLLNKSRRKCDRSLRRDDRCAFLESIINTRQILYLSYTGRSDRDNEPVPPSIVLQELKDYLAEKYNLTKITLPDGNSGLSIETLHHLNAIHPDYFSSTSEKLFSYSARNLLATRQLLAANENTQNNIKQPTTSPPYTHNHQSMEIELDTLKDFFSNPARYFYKHILDIQLDPRKSLLPDDDEPLTLNTLDRYNLKLTILNKIIHNNFEIPDDITGLVKAGKIEGIIPVNTDGDYAVQKLTHDINQWLNSTLPVAEWQCDSLKYALQQQLIAENIPAVLETSINNNPIIINGAYKIFPLNLNGTVSENPDSNPTQQETTLPVCLETRPADLKNKDRIYAWITHIFACALAEDRPYTIIAGTNRSNPRQCSSIIFKPLKKETAHKLMQELITLYLYGNATPLPFAPDTSGQYYLAVSNNPENKDAALYSAYNKWGLRGKSFPGTRPEIMDNSMFHAFGEYGPMIEKEKFTATAENFFSAMLDAEFKVQVS